MAVETFIQRKSVILLLTLFVLTTLLVSLEYVGVIAAVKKSSFNQFCRSDEIDWAATDPETWNAEQIMSYFQWTNQSSCRLTHDFGGKMMKHPSGLDGQKAICLDPIQVAPPAGNCFVYSFGINNEWSFDQAMADYGCQVYAFDPSMKAEEHDRTPLIHFSKFGLNSVDSTSPKGWRFRTLASIYNTYKGRYEEHVIDYLKIDIEYDEWVAIPQIIESGMLDKVRQLGVEFHLPIEDTLSRMRDRVRTIRSLENNGMIRFDSKLNPWYHGTFKHLGISGPRGYEIAWYNKKFLTLAPS